MQKREHWRAKVAKRVSDTTDIKKKNVTTDEGYFIMMEDQKGKTIKNRSRGIWKFPQYMKQKIDKSQL